MTSTVRAVDPVRSVHPPAWLVRRVVNPAARLLVRSPLARRAPALALLRFQGRRTKRNFEIPVMIHDCDDTAIVCTDARWSANFIGGASVSVCRAGRTVHTTAAVIDDKAHAAALIRCVLAEKGPRALGLALAAGHEPSDAELNGLRTVISVHSGE